MSDTPVVPAAPETPVQPDAPAPTPLDQVPLSEFVSRRGKGETSAGVLPAPVEPPAELPDEGETVEESAAQPEDKNKPGKPKSRFEERLGVLTRQRHDAERKYAAEQERAAKLEAELAALKPKAEPQAPVLEDKPPVLDEYLAAGKSYEDWIDARTEYRAQKVADQRIAAERQRVIQEAQQREYETQTAGFAERTEAAKAKYADYDNVVVANDRVVLSPVMQDIARRSPFGPDIMYWLGTHEAEANQIGQLTAYYPQASYPLVEAHLLLLSGLTQSNGNPGAKKVVPVSQAPAPITPVGSGTATQPTSLDQAPLGEFVRRRNADIKKRLG